MRWPDENAFRQARSMRLHAEQALLPGGLVPERVITLRGGFIVSVDAGTAAEADHSVPFVAPAFVDMQINGGGGVQFNEDPTPAALVRIMTAARAGGTGAILPTFVTAEGRRYGEALEAVRQALRAGTPGIVGIHLEGPFLNPVRKGVHDPRHIRPIDEEDIELLCAHQVGVRLVTLAPELVPPGTIARLVGAGWIVFAGHSAASWEDMRQAHAEGLVGVTHLFNAMEPLAGRSPGVIGSTFELGLYAGIIADGVHVHESNVALAARLLPDRLCLVTDAMLTLASDVEAFELGGRRIVRQGDRLVGPDGQLAGAHLAMDGAVRRVGALLGAEAALRMASEVPAKCLGLIDWRIAPGRNTPMCLLDRDLRAMAVV